MITKEMETKIDRFIAANRQNILDDIAKLVAFRSVSQETGDPAMPFGQGCRDAVDAALEICSAKGLKVRNYDYYAASAWMGEGEKEIDILGHLDVVPEGKGWSHDPYDMLEKDGYIYGRGVADDKGPTVLGLYAMLCLRELGVPLRYTYRLVMGSCEETGMTDMPHFMKHEKLPVFAFTPDADFAVCIGEKGIMTFDVKLPLDGTVIHQVTGGQVSNAVCDEATALLKGVKEEDLGDYCHSTYEVTQEPGGIRLTAKGRTSHAAKPEGSVNAILRLFELVERLPQLSHRERAAAQGVCALLGDYNGKGIGIPCEDQPSGKITHISGMVRTQEGQLVLNFNVRYPVTCKGPELVERLKAHIAAKGFEVELHTDSAPSYSPADTPEVQALLSAYDQATGEKGEPYVIGGGTYARHFPNAVAFGPHFVGTPNPAGEGKGGEHMPDECASIENALKAVKIYTYALLHLNELSL